MKTERLVIILGAANLAVLFCISARPKPEAQQGVQSIIRARAIELVDGHGRVRASLDVATNGEAVFRLRDARENIRLKLGASEDGSGLLLLDGSTNPGLHVLAKGGNTTLTLINKDGGKRVIEP
ncbi:MAG: hypothetical protein ACR2OZ_13200 [Verrucomicrobiales bacterium]